VTAHLKDAVNPATCSVNEFRLDGKIAVITGRGSGIGRALALKFAANGAAVHIMDISEDDAIASRRKLLRPTA
jgi:NAD(P)-dependent dehydrogenase (short-subunit alcohol dehydrogenase family)